MPQNCPINLTPLSQATLPNTPQIFNLNYTNQDFWSIKSRLVDFCKQRFGPTGTDAPNTFNDFVESSIAIMLLENMAFVGDTLSFKMDQQINELFIDTVTELDNAFRLSRLVGFQPQAPIAASSLWSASINNTLLSDLVIPTPVSIDVVSNTTPITIELFASDPNNNPLFDDDIIIPAGQTTNINIVGLEGKTFTDTATGTGVIGQSVQLKGTPVIWDSVRVSVDGTTWNQVDYFTDSQPRREFRVEFDSEYNGFVIFGNGRAGLIPSQGSNIQLTYRVGGGVVGNIVTGYVNTQRQAFVPGLEVNVPITYTNYTSGQYGYDGDTIDNIRTKLPAYLRLQNRCVSGGDYKTFADQFATPYNGQVGKATAVLRNYGCAGNIIDVYIMALNGSSNLIKASNELKVALTEAYSQVQMLTDFVCIRDGSVVSVDVSLDVSLDKSYRKFEQEISTQVTAAINAFFSLDNWDYGETLKDSDLIKSLSDIKQIDSADVTFTTGILAGGTITTNFFEIIRPGTVDISFMYT